MAAILVRPGEATVILAYRSGRLSVARDQFEVLGVRGDINKSTTFGTEDKCNPLEATIGAALRYQTLRSLTATEIGAGTVNVAKMVRGGLPVTWNSRPLSDLFIYLYLFTISGVASGGPECLISRLSALQKSHHWHIIISAAV